MEAINDPFYLEMTWRGEDPADSLAWQEWYSHPKDGVSAFIQRTVRPEARRTSKLSSIQRRLVMLIMGRWKDEERITATWLASEFYMSRRDFYRHPVTKRWKSVAKELICNTAAHDKFLGRKHGQGFREEVCLPLSDEEIDERLGWAEP